MGKTVCPLPIDYPIARAKQIIDMVKPSLIIVSNSAEAEQNGKDLSIIFEFEVEGPLAE